jgi:glutamate-ammonia-ligase adenylyltransferase
MNIESRITRLPRPFDLDHAADSPSFAPWASGEVAKLLHGMCGSSPYLRGLLQKEGDWLENAQDDPEKAICDVMAEISAGSLDAVDHDLRQAKRRIALISAICDLGGVWQLEQVTGTLTDFADFSVQMALQAAVGREIRRGKLPGQTEDDIVTAGGMVALAMGKMGAGELN